MGIVLLMSSMSQARQPDRKIVLLTCPSDIAESGLLCQAVAQALAEAIPSGIIKSVSSGDQTQIRADGIVVTLVISDVTVQGMTGRLDWQIGQGQRQNGIDIRLGVMDATLSPKMYDRFAHLLVRESDEMVKTINSSRLE